MATKSNYTFCYDLSFPYLKLFLFCFPALPVLTSSLQTVSTAYEGIPKSIICSVKSRPASNITWSRDSGVVGVATQNLIQSGYYFVTTGNFTIDKPLYSMRGKSIFCTVEAKFGAPIKQNTSLNVLCKFALDFFITMVIVTNFQHGFVS